MLDTTATLADTLFSTATNMPGKGASRKDMAIGYTVLGAVIGAIGWAGYQHFANKEKERRAKRGDAAYDLPL